MVKKIAILTSGGDAPGMNAALRACIRSGLASGVDMYVIYDGYRGLVNGEIKQVNKDFTQDIINRGGTIIRSARLPEFKEEKIVKRAARQLADFEIDGLIGIGGDGTFRGLGDLAKFGVKCVGIPATIDNDVGSTDETIGFATALNTICECVDKLKDTSGSHQRCSLIEVMGRHCGDLAMFAALAEGAEGVICVEHPLKEEVLFRKLRKMKAQNKSHAIIIVSENLLNIEELRKKIEDETGFDARTEVLGRLQRGGCPVAHDRILAARMGDRAVNILVNGAETPSRIVGMKKGELIDMDINEALALKHEHTHGLRDLIDKLQ
ncbi:MAG: ATP-dependent 6-phosphofructokinase [Bacilli bacterium]|nr:ATP-dependent 6-phosphofructokinase [Bacilli bacterium]